MNNSFHIMDVTEGDINVLVPIYVDAFETNPAYASIFPELQGIELRRALDWFFRVRMSIALEYEYIYLKIVDESGKVIGAAAASPPNRSISWFTKIQKGLLLWPFYWGLKSFTSLLDLDSRMFHKDDAWSLAMVAVSQQHRGQSMGSQLLSSLLSRIAAHNGDAQDCEIYLETQLEINTRFYGKHGFEMFKEEMLVDYRNGEHYKSYVMRRKTK